MGWLWIGVIVGCLLGVGAVWTWVSRDLRRMTRFLDERQPGSNARLTVGLPGYAPRALTESINRQLDAVQSEHIAMGEERASFQRDMSALAHDVRTPLMGARGHLQLALDDAGISDESTRHIMAALNRLDNMQGLLDQLFDYAKASDPDLSLDLEPVELHPLLAGILVGHLAEFDALGWEPVVDFEDEQVHLDADQGALTRILDNLVTNALRHGAGAPVIIQRGRSLSLTNLIDPAEAASLDSNRLFSRFYQADDSRGSQGSGLGLSVAAALASAMCMTLTATFPGTPADAQTSPSLAITLTW